MIIDNKSCANIASTTLVQKLNLNTIKHEKLYRLVEWLWRVRITKQVFIRMRIFVILCLCMQLIYYWGDLYNLIEIPSMMKLKISILSSRMRRHSYLYHYSLEQLKSKGESEAKKKKINLMRMWGKVNLTVSF